MSTSFAKGRARRRVATVGHGLELGSMIHSRHVESRRQGADLTVQDAKNRSTRACSPWPLMRRGRKPREHQPHPRAATPS